MNKKLLFVGVALIAGLSSMSAMACQEPKVSSRFDYSQWLFKRWVGTC
ncbi:MAG: hypothetical protein Q4A69_02440 [Moraxella sp.]|nr:hypothetical protein [Moraxella sp.]